MHPLMTLLADPNTWISLATLTVLEIVLGIDNLVLLVVMVEKLPMDRRPAARKVGLALALITRLLLLASLSWMLHLTQPVLTAFGHTFSWRDIVLIAGGLFLLFKTTSEIHGNLEAAGGDALSFKGGSTFAVVVVQIAFIDIVFSLDSVITAVGMVGEISIMATAIVIAVIVMLFASGPLGHFVERHPTVKMLAFSFLLLVGTTLVAEGMGFHVPKGYLYFAMAFSALVETLNILVRRRAAKAESGS